MRNVNGKLRLYFWLNLFTFRSYIKIRHKLFALEFFLQAMVDLHWGFHFH